MVKNLIQFVMILVLVALVIGGGVAALYGWLEPRIDARDARAKRDAIRAVVPEGAAIDVDDPLAGEPFAPDAVYVAAGEGGRPVAYVASGGARGYSSVVRVMVGVRADDLAIHRVVVLAQQETPGLGANVARQESNYTLWEKLLGPNENGKAEALVNPFLDRFRGKGRREVPDIQGITAATITSDATKAAVQEALNRIREATGGQTVDSDASTH